MSKMAGNFSFKLGLKSRSAEILGVKREYMSKTAEIFPKTQPKIEVSGNPWRNPRVYGKGRRETFP